MRFSGLPEEGGPALRQAERPESRDLGGRVRGGFSQESWLHKLTSFTPLVLLFQTRERVPGEVSTYALF